MDNSGYIYYVQNGFLKKNITFVSSFSIDIDPNVIYASLMHSYGNDIYGEYIESNNTYADMMKIRNKLADYITLLINCK